MYEKKTGISYDESMVTFLLGNEASPAALCMIDRISSVNIGTYPVYGDVDEVCREQARAVLEASFKYLTASLDDGDTAAVLVAAPICEFDRDEAAWIESMSSTGTKDKAAVQIVSAIEGTEKLLNNSLSAKAAYAAQILGSMSEDDMSNDDTDFDKNIIKNTDIDYKLLRNTSKILVTGYDTDGTYHNVILRTYKLKLVLCSE